MIDLRQVQAAGIDLARLRQALTPRLTPFIPHRPTPKQAAFLLVPGREALYGGAAGGGKSDALLMGALQYVDVPDYAAILFRRTYADLALPGAIMDRSHDWLAGTAARWREATKTWHFPSGATLSFGYLQAEKDKYRYQSAEFQYIGFDELTQYPSTQYLYLFSRLRRNEGSQVPLRMRSASNPGGESGDFVYRRFVHPSARRTGRVFIPAKLDDNPHLDRQEYITSLAELDPITRQQLLDGLWITDPLTKPFKREYWRHDHLRYFVTDRAGASNVVARWVSWDTGLKDKETSAYSSYAVLELLADYRVRIREVGQERLLFPDLVPMIQGVANRWNQDGRLRGVIIEDKASGISAIQTLRLAANAGELPYAIIAFEPHGDKFERATQAAVWCSLGCVMLPWPTASVPWFNDFTTDLYSFPDIEFKDRVDATVQGIIYLEHLLAEGYHARQAQGAAEATDGDF